MVTTRSQSYNIEIINIFRLNCSTFDPVINFDIGDKLAKINLQNNNENINLILDFLRKLSSFSTGNVQQRRNTLYLIYVLLLNNIWWLEISNSTQKFKQVIINRLPTDFLYVRKLYAHKNTRNNLHDFVNVIVELSKKLNIIILKV